MDYDPRKSQPLERTRCAISFEGFSDQATTLPEVGVSLETWKRLAVAVEGQFPDPYRLVRCLANTTCPPPIVFLWRLSVEKNGRIKAHIELCVRVEEPDLWDNEFRISYWRLATPQSPRRYPLDHVIIDAQRACYIARRNEAVESIEDIARELARELRLPDDPSEYAPPE